LIEGREYVIPDDVKAMARYVLPHRLELDRRTMLEDVSSFSLIDDVLKETPVPR
jgi:MoxR-like ATPase